jgi:hypothetical protein
VQQFRAPKKKLFGSIRIAQKLA